MDVASDPSPPYLSVRNLSFRTASQQVLLQDVSFDLPKASVLAIAGPNGAGKTTLLNLLSGMEEVTQGEVTINGASLRTMPMDVRAHKIAVVAQHAAPDHRLSVQ
ncbi:MAG: ABC transporter ATP-binding protein, partial [Pseudomonadota bacterium]